MKIAIESHDGVNIASPFNLFKSFMIFEFDEESKLLKSDTPCASANLRSRMKLVRNIAESKNIIRELSDCSTVISHNLSRPLLNRLQNLGVDVFITFRNRIDDAVGQYLRDKLIHENTGGN
jgi:predicted Fe-Mo cluster-binding NifX family protein